MKYECEICKIEFSSSKKKEEVRCPRCGYGHSIKATLHKMKTEPAVAPAPITEQKVKCLSCKTLWLKKQSPTCPRCGSARSEEI